MGASDKASCVMDSLSPRQAGRQTAAAAQAGAQALAASPRLASSLWDEAFSNQLYHSYLHLSYSRQMPIY